jgi:hypothetical protein
MPSNPNPPGTPGNPFPCGGQGQQPCPPQPTTAADWKTPFYTHEDLLRHGKAAYEKGKADAERS